MPSSTSSSSARAPRARYGRLWLVTLVAVVAMVAVLEDFVRRQKYDASMTDSADLWAYHRVRLSQGDPDKRVAVLGASRIQCALVPEVFDRLCPDYHLVQLGVIGTSPLAALRELADDESFRGLAICSVTVNSFDGIHGESQQPYVENYLRHFRHLDRFGRLFEQRLRMAIQGRLAVLNPEVNVGLLLRMGIRHPGFLTVLPDRSRRAMFRAKSPPEWMEVRTARIVRRRQKWALGAQKVPAETRAKAWPKRLGEVSAFIQRIEQRGGRVVFLRLPDSGEVWDIFEATYPKALFWDQLAGAAGVTTIHFMDVPDMQGYDCPDGVHMDFQDAPRFTEVLVRELTDRGLLAPASGEEE